MYSVEWSDATMDISTIQSGQSVLPAYTAALLDVFESDLLRRKALGISDVVFKGASGLAKVRGEGSVVAGEVEGMPADLLRHVVVSLFGERRQGAITWRGFRLNALPVMFQHEVCDTLSARLSLPRVQSVVAENAMLDVEKAQTIMAEAIHRLMNEAGMECAQAIHIFQPNGETSMVLVIGSRMTVEKTILQLDPLPIR